MEAALYEGAQPDTFGNQRGAGVEIGGQWQRPMVELGSVTYESGATEEAMGSTRTSLNTGYDKPA
jgi:hypothetical protein